MQLRHRAAFLAAGHFDAISAAIAEHVRGVDANPAFAPWRILDAGFGTGHHLAKLAAALPAPVVGLGLDIAREAARQAARRWPHHAFAVADLWGEWPVHDAGVDLVVSIFAPKNLPEVARVLRPGGWFAMVYPGPDHLVELGDRFRLIGQHDDKTERYRDLARRFIGSPTIHRLFSRTVLEATAIRAAILMGPNARHIASSILDAELGPEPGPTPVTFDVTLLFSRKP
jgi:23S rRNA (guanine745-N1)-methyltransferase